MPPFDKYPCKNRRCPTEGHYYPRALIPSLYPLPLWSISKNNTIWHTDKRTDIWSQPSCIHTQIFNPKKTGFSPHKYISQISCWLLLTFNLCNFSVWTSKVAHNRPKPLYFTFQPRIDFLVLWYIGTRHLFSYLWFNIAFPDN